MNLKMKQKIKMYGSSLLKKVHAQRLPMYKYIDESITMKRFEVLITLLRIHPAGPVPTSWGSSNDECATSNFMPLLSTYSGD